MKAVRKKSFKILIQLDEREAKMLRDMVQNTRHADLQNEPKAESEFRKTLFETLKENLES